MAQYPFYIKQGNPSLGAQLGQALGTGLQALAQHKLQQVKQRNLTSALGNYIPQEQASMLAQLPESLQQIFLKDILAAPKERAYAQALGLGIPSQEAQLEMGQPQQAGMQAPQLTERQATEVAKFRQKERQAETAERKETRKYLEPYEAAYQKGQATIQENKELKALAKTGNLRAGALQKVADTLGLNEFFRPIENELAQKTLDRQAQNAASAFNTSRLTNLDVNLYKRSLGTLWNSAEGLYTIASINNLAQKSRAALHKARREIIRENKGAVPYDIEELAENRAQPLMQRLAQKAEHILMHSTERFNKPKSFNSINDALKHLSEGDTITDSKTGKVYDWQGKVVG